jgi:hypothetical protein
VAATVNRDLAVLSRMLPSCRGRAGRWWRTTGYWPHMPAGARRSCRQLRVTTPSRLAPRPRSRRDGCRGPRCSAACSAIEVLVCPRCAGPRRIVGAVIEPHAVRRLLGALGLAAQPPPVPAPPRDPPSIPASTPSLRRPSLPADPWEPVLTYVSPLWPLRAGLAAR